MSRWPVVLVCLLSIAILLTISVLDLLPSPLKFNFEGIENVWSFSMDCFLSLLLFWSVKRVLSFYCLRKKFIVIGLILASVSLLLVRLLAANVIGVVYFFVGIISSQLLMLLSSLIFTRISYDLHVSIVSHFSVAVRPVIAAVYSVCLLLSLVLALFSLKSQLLLLVHLAATVLPLVLLSVVPDILPVNWLTLSLESVFALMFLLFRSSLLSVAVATGGFLSLSVVLLFRFKALKAAIRSILAEVIVGGRRYYSEISSEDNYSSYYENGDENSARNEELQLSETNDSGPAEEMWRWLFLVSGLFVVAVLFLLCFSEDLVELELGAVSWLLHWTVFYCSWWMRTRQFLRFQVIKEEVGAELEEKTVRGEEEQLDLV